MAIAMGFIHQQTTTARNIMNTIRALSKFAYRFPGNAKVIDTTANYGQWRELSPFVLPAPPARNLENLWQYSKVYPNVQPNSHVDSEGNPNGYWYAWRLCGWNDTRAQRYPMGKGKIPLYSFWNGEKLDYITARKKIYAPEYAKNVIMTEAYKKLGNLYCTGHDIILLDYDAYDHIALSMSLHDVINNPNRKMGHAFVLIMMLTGVLNECLDINNDCPGTLNCPEIDALGEYPFKDEVEFNLVVSSHCAKCEQGE